MWANVTFYDKNNVPIGTPVSVLRNAPIPSDKIPAVAPADPGYMIAWYTTSAHTVRWNLTANVTGDLNLYLQYTPTAYDVTISTDQAIEIAYSVNGGLTWTNYDFSPSGGSKTITVPAGQALHIKVVSSHDGYRAEWGDGRPTKVINPEYTRDVNANLNVTLYLVELKDGEGFDLMLLLILLAVAAGAAIGVFLWYRRRAVIVGTVRHNGAGVEGVRIEYTKKGGSSAKSVTTGADGKYKIKTSMKADIVIAASGASGTEITIKKKVTEQDFNI
jgi:hypothetical protein